MSRWFIRTALGYLLFALVFGVVQPALPARAQLWPSYVHLLVLGWLTQLIFGVAHWMFPRRREGMSRCSERLGWATYALLNLGLLIRLVAESSRDGPGNQLVLVIAGVLLLAAGWGFVVNTWPRVKGK